MRATISFETDVGEVEGTMAVLACSEEHNLRAAADLLSDFTVLDGSVLDAITEVCAWWICLPDNLGSTSK